MECNTALALFLPVRIRYRQTNNLPAQTANWAWPSLVNTDKHPRLDGRRKCISVRVFVMGCNFYFPMLFTPLARQHAGRAPISPEMLEREKKGKPVTEVNLNANPFLPIPPATKSTSRNSKQDVSCTTKNSSRFIVPYPWRVHRTDGVVSKWKEIASTLAALCFGTRRMGNGFLNQL